MTTMYTCPKCEHILGGDLHTVVTRCPKCGQAFDPAVMLKIARFNRLKHIWIFTLLLGTFPGFGLAVATVIPSGIKPKFGGPIMLATTAAATAAAFYAVSWYDRKRFGPR